MAYYFDRVKTVLDDSTLTSNARIYYLSLPLGLLKFYDALRTQNEYARTVVSCGET